MEKVTSAALAAATLESLISDHSALRDEPEFDEVGKAINRVRKLKEFYEALGTIDQRDLKRPDEFHDLQAALANLQGQYGEWLN